MGNAFFNDEISLPVAECLEDSPTLQSWLFRPYTGQEIPEEQMIFNYRLSRTRRVIENALGIHATRWQVFMQPIQSTLEEPN